MKITIESPETPSGGEAEQILQKELLFSSFCFIVSSYSHWMNTILLKLLVYIFMMLKEQYIKFILSLSHLGIIQGGQNALFSPT